MDLARQSPEAELIVGRELTKRHEQIWRGSAGGGGGCVRSPRGEFTLLITPPPTTIVEWSDAEVAAALSEAAQAGESRAAAARRVAAESGASASGGLCALARTGCRRQCGFSAD